MSIFQNYPLLLYPLLLDGILTPVLLTDIMTRVVPAMSDVDFVTMTEEITLLSGDTPESVSYQIYDTPNYYWTILFINNMFDYLDWYKTDEALEQYCKDKYGPGYQDGQFVVDEYGVIVANSKASLATFQTNSAIYTNIKYGGTTTVQSYFDYEAAENEKRRVVRVLRPEYINRFIILFSSALEVVIA